MHILLLGLNYHPDRLGNAPIMTGLCEGLARRGHRVTVICAFPHHEGGRVEPPYRGKLIEREHLNGVEILRTYIYVPRGGTLAKMANYLSFTAAALAAATCVRGVDLVFTPSPPLTLGLVDHALSALRRIPFVYNIQDLFPEAAVRLGVLTNPAMIRGFEHMERFVYRRAHRLAVISEGFRRHLLAMGVPEDKIAVIPNFTDTELIAPIDTAGSVYRRQLGLEDRFVVQFSGRMGHSQGLETVVEAWRLLPDALPDAHLMMVGDGQARPMVERALAGLPNVTLLRTQERSALGELLGAADVGLAPLRRGMAGTSVPSKILGIMAAGRPTIAGVERGSDTDLLLRDADCGVVVPPEDPQALADAIRGLHADRERARRLGANARAYVVEHFSQEATVDRYERLFLETIARPKIA